MAAETLIVDRPPSSIAVLLAGLTTIARSAPAYPTLPSRRLLRPEVTIDPGHLAEYRRLCGFAETQGTPPTYPHLLAFPLHLKLMMLHHFPYPMAGLVHVANRIVQHRAVEAGRPLAVSAAFGVFHTHPRGQAFTIVAQADQDGVPVWESESSYLRIGAPSRIGDPLAMPPAQAATNQVAAETVAHAVAPRYARVSGDRNPIHMSWLGARLFGFKRMIAHGMWTKARALALVLPEAIGQVTIDVAFRAPILLPGRVAFFADTHGPVTSFAVRDGADARPHLIGRLVTVPREEFHAQH